MLGAQLGWRSASFSMHELHRMKLSAVVHACNSGTQVVQVGVCGVRVEGGIKVILTSRKS